MSFFVFVSSLAHVTSTVTLRSLVFFTGESMRLWVILYQGELRVKNVAERFRCDVRTQSDFDQVAVWIAKTGENIMPDQVSKITSDDIFEAPAAGVLRDEGLGDLGRASRRRRLHRSHRAYCRWPRAAAIASHSKSTATSA